MAASSTTAAFSWDHFPSYQSFDPSNDPAMLHRVSTSTASSSISNFDSSPRLDSSSPTSFASNSPVSHPYHLNGSQMAKSQVHLSKPTPAQPKPRAARAIKATSAKRGSSITEDDDEEQPASRKVNKAERKKERNRIAANKCREKARSETETLKALEGQLSQQREELVRSVACLKDEIYQLEQHCFSHVNCNCVSIRNYLLSRMPCAPDANSLPPQPQQPTEKSHYNFDEDANFDLVNFS